MKRMKKWFKLMPRIKHYQLKGYYINSCIGPKLLFLPLSDHNLFVVEKEFRMLGITNTLVDNMSVFKGKSESLDSIIFNPIEEENFIVEQADFTTPLYEFQVVLLPYDIREGVALETKQIPIYLTEDEFVCILACAMLRCPDLTIVAAVNPLLAKKIADQITMVLGIDGDVILVIMQQAIDEVNEYLNNLM